MQINLVAPIWKQTQGSGKRDRHMNKELKLMGISVSHYTDTGYQILENRLRKHSLDSQHIETQDRRNNTSDDLIGDKQTRD